MTKTIHQRKIKTALQVIFLGTLLALTNACQYRFNDIPSPPHTVPFTPRQAGESMQMEFDITKEDTYEFYLAYIPVESKIKQMRELIEQKTIHTWVGSRRYVGLSAPMVLTLEQKHADIYETIMVHDSPYQELTGWGFNPYKYYKYITIEKLKPGIYRLTTQLLEPIDDYGITLNVVLWRAK